MLTKIPRCHCAILFTALLAFASGGVCEFAAAQNEPESARRQIRVPGDRWLEIDLYWFDHANLRQSVDAFWERFAPLFSNVEGHRGLILNVGWTVGYTGNGAAFQKSSASMR